MLKNWPSKIPELILHNICFSRESSNKSIPVWLVGNFTIVLYSKSRKIGIWEAWRGGGKSNFNAATRKAAEQKHNVITALILISCCHKKPQDIPTGFMPYDNLVFFRTMNIHSITAVKLLLLNPPGPVFFFYASVLLWTCARKCLIRVQENKFLQ